MIIDEDIYLEHYGVKGMKWGVRNAASKRRARNLKKYGGKNKKTRTAAQKSARTMRNIKRVHTGIRVASGTLFVLALLSEQKTAAGPRPNFKSYTKPSNSVKDVINRERKVKVDAIEKTFKEGFIDAAQRKQFIDKMNKRYDRKLSDALKNT